MPLACEPTSAWGYVSHSQEDSAGAAVALGADGGVWAAQVVGFMAPNDTRSLRLAHLSANGALEFDRVFEALGRELHLGPRSLVETTDGAVAIAFTVLNTSSCADDNLGTNTNADGGVVTKLSEKGDVIWRRHVGLGFVSLAAAEDGGLVAGLTRFSTNSAPPDAGESEVRSYSAEGELKWKRSGRGGLVAVDVSPSDHSVTLVEDCSSCGEPRFWVVRLNRGGQELWKVPIVGAVALHHAAVTASGTTLIEGEFQGDLLWGTASLSRASNDTVHDASHFLAATDHAGNPVWAQRLPIQDGATVTGASTAFDGLTVLSFAFPGSSRPLLHVYGADGELACSQPAWVISRGELRIRALASRDEAVVAGGVLTGTADFGAGAVTSQLQDAFFWKFSLL
jgi:hypothetical protein